MEVESDWSDRENTSQYDKSDTDYDDSHEAPISGSNSNDVIVSSSKLLKSKRITKNKEIYCFERFCIAVGMYYRKNRELIFVICLSVLWFLSNITILKSKEVRYQQYGPLFPPGQPVRDYPDGDLGFLHPQNRSRLDHLLMLYAPWDAESVLAKTVFSALALINPQIRFAAVACWNVTSECWLRFHTTRFPAFALLLPGLTEVIYNGPLDLAHMQRFLMEAPLGYRTVRSDAELLRITQLYDNVVIGCYNLSARPVIPGLHQFYAASVHAFDLFAPLPFLLPEFDSSEKFHCEHNGQVILLRSGDISLTPDTNRSLRCSELLGWLRQHRIPSRLAMLHSTGAKSRRLADMLQPKPPASAGSVSPSPSKRPLLLLFDPGPRHWDSPALVWLRFIDAVYARDCDNAKSDAVDVEEEEEDESRRVDSGFKKAMALALARVANDLRLKAEAAALGRVCSDLASAELLSNRCYATFATAWQRLYGQRPTASEAGVLSGRLHRLCLLASLCAASPHSPERPPFPSTAATSSKLMTAVRSLHRLSCSTAASVNRTLGLAFVSSRWHPHLLRGLLGPNARLSAHAAVIVDLADGGGSATRLNGPVNLASLVQFLLRHHAGQLRPFRRPPTPPTPPLRTVAAVDFPVTLTAASLPAFALNASRDTLVLFHSPACIYCAPFVAMATRISLSLGHRLPVGAIDVSANDLDATWRPARVPALLLFPAGSQADPVIYSGPATSASLVDFLTRHSSASIGLRAWAGLAPCHGQCPAQQVDRLAKHVLRLQTRLDSGLELAQFAEERLAETRWSLGRLIVSNWLRLGAQPDRPASPSADADILRLRAGAYSRVLNRCRRLVNECAAKRDRSLQLLMRMRQMLTDSLDSGATEAQIDWLRLAGETVQKVWTD